MNGFKNIKWSPLSYVEASVLAQEVGKEMLSRLDWMTLQPNVIVDVGCGIGEGGRYLQKRYPNANVIALDLSDAMITHAKEQNALSGYVCADAGQLPLRAQSVDLIFANFLLPWHQHPRDLLKEWRRILSPDGLLMVTALGPDTLQECKEIVNQEHIPQCMDMHDIGDLLLKEGFADPVLDVDHYTMTYQSQEKLMTELIASGMLVAVPSESLVPTKEGIWPITYEVIYAHAFAPTKTEHATAVDGVVKIPLSRLRQQLIAK